MMRTSENLKRIFKFREKKSKEFKRNISYSEAVALWLTENTQNNSSQKAQK